MEKGNKGENDALCFGNMPPTIEYGGGGGGGDKPPLYRLRGIRMTTLQRTRNGIVVHRHRDRHRYRYTYTKVYTYNYTDIYILNTYIIKGKTL